MSKISELSDGGALQSTDYLIAVRSGGNVKVQPGSMSVDINGGTIDGVTIGGSSAGAITGTTGQFNTSLNVDGTVTADGLTVDGDVLIRTFADANPFVVSRSGNTTESLQITFDDSSAILTSEQDEAGRYGGYVFNSKNDGTTVKRMEIAHTTGDISFYDSAGSSQSLYWDASTERLGIGTTSPAEALHIYHPTENVNAIIESGDANAYLSFKDSTTSAANGVYLGVTDGDNMGFYTGGNTARMYIDSSGDVGIGTDSPSSELHVSSSGSTVLTVERTTAGSEGKLLLSSATNENIIYSRDGSTGAKPLRFIVGASEAMRLDASGNLLVGGTATNPAGSNADGFAVSSAGRLNVQTSGSYHRMGRGEDGFIVAFYSEGAVEGSIAIAGSTTSYNTSSDYRLKDVDGPITTSGAYIDALKPVQGSWKADGSRFIGLIAHEVQEVSETPIATGEKDGEEMQGMDYSAPELIANLIAEIQSLRARVAQLEGA